MSHAAARTRRAEMQYMPLEACNVFDVFDMFHVIDVFDHIEVFAPNQIRSIRQVNANVPALYNLYLWPIVCRITHLPCIWKFAIRFLSVSVCPRSRKPPFDFFLIRKTKRAKIEII